MAAPFESWESYFYPPPDDQTLRNLFDERDPVVLSRLEYVETVERQRELMASEVSIPFTYDGAHIRAIHQHLFQDVYEWAGQYRTVNISKNLSTFADVESGQWIGISGDAQRLVQGTKWDQLNRREFVTAAAAVFAYINQAHPFREGNGRTAKVFIEHVAEQSRFTLDFARVSPEAWNNASMLSGPDLGAYDPVPDSLLPIFERIAVERPSGRD